MLATLPRSAVEHYRKGQQLKAVTVAAVRRSWDTLRPTGTWGDQFGRLSPQILALLSAAQLAAVRQSDAYTVAVLAETGVDPDAGPVLNPGGFVATAGNGLPVADLLPFAVTRAGDTYAAGASEAQALQAGRDWLDMFVETLLADTIRAATSSGMTAHRRAGGYVRMLNPPSCSRCTILAGKFYRWNTGFQRHPRCDCVHIPAREALAGDLTTNPNAYFDSLTAAEQDRIFTKAGAQAIRDGADISQVVNARAGMSTAQINPLTGRSVGRLQTVDVYGRRAYITTTSTTKRGRAYRPRSVRLMPESIYDLAAGDREEAIRLLRLHGYLI